MPPNHQVSQSEVPEAARLDEVLDTDFEKWTLEPYPLPVVDREVVTTPDPLAAQLRALRRGRGLLAPDLRRRLGEQLARVCGVDTADDTVTIRLRVSSAVEELLGQAPEEIRRAVKVALAIDAQAQFATLTARRDWLAQVTFCDVRTVRRREDQGFDVMAAGARSVEEGEPVSPQLPGRDWHVERFRALLRLDRPTPDLVEERRIVADRPGLAEIVASLSLAQPAGAPAGLPVDVDVLHGAWLVRVDEVSPSHTRAVLRLPRTLDVSESHEYGIAFRLRPDRRMKPHYAFVPFRLCEKFEVVVRFDLDRLPSAVWRLDGVPPRVLDDCQMTDDLLCPDAVGEVRLSWDVPVQGFAYGLGWVLPEPSAR